jgi:citrate synthase
VPENPVAAVAAGMLATGSVTGSPADAVAMIYRAYGLQQQERLSPEGTAARVVDGYLSERKRIPGIGHPLHTRFDPRAEALRRAVTRLGRWQEKASLFDAIHGEFVRRRGSFIPQNLAGVAGCVYAELGFEPLEVSALSAVGYAMALVAHVVEEIKEGVPLRIVPQALGAKYVGPPERHIAGPVGGPIDGNP